MKKPARKTLLLIGPKRGPGRVRVYEDLVRQLVTVQYGKREKTSFALTRAGRAEALAFAKSYHEEKARPAAAAAPTVRELWRRYCEAQFGELRPKTRIGHQNRWKPWERFVFHDTVAADVNLEHLDRFKAELLKQEYESNQVGKMLGLVKQVFRWGVERRLLTASDVPGYRVRLALDAKPREPEEYRLEEFEALTRTIGSPQDPRAWRAWVTLMLVGHQGVRLNAVLHLRPEDVRDGLLWWQSGTDKRGRTWCQPIRDGALSAILTALWWREQDGYTGPWLIYPRPKGEGGGRADRSGRVWTDGHEPYTHQAFYRMLSKAETRAGIPHLEYRAAHGFRKMVAGEVLRITGNPKDAMDFIGDRDLGLIKTYLKARDDRKADVAEQLDHPKGGPELHPEMGSRTAPAEGGAVAVIPKSHWSELNRRPLGSNRDSMEGESSQSPTKRAKNTTVPAANVDKHAPKGAPEVHPKNVQHPAEAPDA